MYLSELCIFNEFNVTLLHLTLSFLRDAIDADMALSVSQLLAHQERKEGLWPSAGY